MRGKDSDIYYFSGASSKGTEFREYSEGQMRLGAHLKLDYRAGERHKFMFYSGYMDMRESEVRDARNSQDWMMRMKYNRQYIFNSTLKGEHAFSEDKALKLDWTGVFSYAYNMTPDEARINMNGYNLAKDDAANRRWAHNSDRDLAGYVNLSYLFDFHNSSTLLLKAGECTGTRSGTASSTSGISTPPRKIRRYTGRTGTISTSCCLSQHTRDSAI